ncbi:MAG: hypothetical protein V4469_05125 [Patescibacteria group bacterium]
MSKTEADNLKKIEVWWLLHNMKDRDHKSITISWGENGNKGHIGCEVNLNEDANVRFHYSQTDTDSGEKKDFDYKVSLVKTPCYFGKYRFWFECPARCKGINCQRRVGVLYKDGDYFACRHCYNLTYSSKKISPRYKLFPLFQFFNLEKKITALEKKTKRKTWKKVSTKKQNRLSKLYKQSVLNLQRYERDEKTLLDD